MPEAASHVTKTSKPAGLSRREMLGAGAAIVLGGGLAATLRLSARNEGGLRSDVFIGAADGYGADLPGLVLAGLSELGLTRDQVRGKRVLLKPNLVETARGEYHINTSPSLAVAAIEAFRRLDAFETIVAEGQGHQRDSQIVLDESGMGAALQDAKVRFVDLNHDDCVEVPNKGGWSKLGPLHLPKTLLSADIVVSMPKLKTHHWAGMTCGMKNLFGVMPGIAYGWPKNVLHYAGIAESILDINATVRPSLAIVDAIVCMEGDGPIMGTPKTLNCIVMGRNLPAVDATCARLMGFNPYGIKYLKRASARLGPIHEWNISQRGEQPSRFAAKFSLPEEPHLASVVSG
jgi:uncharacterized protein (DUF362 family)